jgi:hypothetical protein
VSSLKESLVAGCSAVFVGPAAAASPALWWRQPATPLRSWGWWAVWWRQLASCWLLRCVRQQAQFTTRNGFQTEQIRRGKSVAQQDEPEGPNGSRHA